MKYKAYPEYKNSGVEWLGEVPGHWNKTRIKNISKIYNGSTPNSAAPEFWDGDIAWVTPSDLSKLKTPFIKESERKITKEGYESCGTTLVPEGAIIISSRAPIGSIGIAAQKLCTNQGCKSLVYESNIIGSFLYYLLISNVKKLNILGRGTTFLELSSNELGGFQLLLPPLPEQKAIASFLDNQTSKIDTMIEKQEKLINLLQEKRQAVISHAVTKGLNPDVKMKDSGIEWLGEVPEHWKVKPLRYLGITQNGISAGSEYFGSGYPFLTYSDVYKNSKIPYQLGGLANSSLKDQELYSVKKGDIFFTRTSETIEEVGFTSTCFKTIQNSTFAGFLIRFRPYVGILHEGFSEYYFRAKIHRSFFIKHISLVTRASLSQDTLKLLPVILPPLPEQKVIAEFLDNQTAKIDTLIEKAKRMIELLKERRTALISAAVTGKIDVRNTTVQKNSELVEMK